MKYKILLITSVLATVPFCTHGAEGGAAAAAALPAIPAEERAAPRLFTVNDFSPNELRYMSTDLGMTPDATIIFLSGKSPLSVHAFVKIYKTNYLYSLINKVKSENFPSFKFKTNDLTKAEKALLYTDEMMASKRELSAYIRTVAQMPPKKRHKKNTSDKNTISRRSKKSTLIFYSVTI